MEYVKVPLKDKGFLNVSTPGFVNPIEREEFRRKLEKLVQDHNLHFGDIEKCLVDKEAV